MATVIGPGNDELAATKIRNCRIVLGTAGIAVNNKLVA